MLGNLNSVNSSFRHSSPLVRSNDITPTDLSAWTSKNHFRTSSNDMGSKTPITTKSCAIPGYSGYIPGARADDNFGSTFTKTVKEQFNRQKYLNPRATERFPNRPYESSSPMRRTHGKFGGGLEEEYHTISRFHGKCTIPQTHPNYADDSFETTYRKSYVNQEKKRPEIYRTTDTGFWKNVQVSNRPSTQASGFVQNSTLFDGHGWEPIKKLHGDMATSEYRNRFNPERAFHPLPLKQNLRTLKKKALVY
ncbi:unnamed protein product [Blepharisma stoltei]|uniref:Uncharacterized protein n=1 Tax=Blepharisma stoltei TaxID=1481888 RepID=A0AAU9J7N0_9CILI|nr:unnamed protein product [Blepharisma stoltei]